MSPADEENERALERLFMRMQVEKSPDERRRIWREIVERKARRSPELVREIEKEKGLEHD